MSNAVLPSRRIFDWYYRGQPWKS